MEDTNVTFTNQLRDAETLGDISEDKIKQFLAEHALIDDKEIQVTFFHTGVSSLVCKVETHTKCYVLKIALRSKPIDESIFLQIWSEAGVSVPHIFETGDFFGKNYFFLEYIDAKVLSQHYTPKELVADNIYFTMGRILKIMHTPDAQGFGRPNGAAGQYKTFTDWLTEGEDIQEALDYVRSKNLYPAHTNIINQSIETLLQNIGDDAKSSFCHDDYTIENIFATQPLTVFDPNPKYNNGYIDLGRSIASIISYGYERDLEDKAIQQLIDGYSSGDTDVSTTITAAIVLGIIWKSPYPHRTGKVAVIDIFNLYLSRFT